MEAEGLTIDSFDVQKRKGWKISGKNFYEIFSKVKPPDFYKYLYGIPSESIHGSWNDSIDFNLIKNEDGTFFANPFYQDVDIRFVSPLILVTNDPYLLWLERIDAKSEYVIKTFDWIKSINYKLFNAFEEVYKIKND